METLDAVSEPQAFVSTSFRAVGTMDVLVMELPEVKHFFPDDAGKSGLPESTRCMIIKSERRNYDRYEKLQK